MSTIYGLVINIDSSQSVKLYLDGQYSDVNWDNRQATCLENVYSCPLLEDKNTFDSGIAIDVSMDGRETINITETKQYRLQVESDDDSAVELPVFPNEGQWLKCRRDKDSMSFRFVNFLGRSRMKFANRDIEFEVIPDKISYKNDYVELTEEIASKCAALLIEHSGSTSLLFKQDETSADTIIEQFIFLRQFCLEDNLMSLFEAIKRNPDRLLETEEVFKPMGMGVPSRKFFSHPFAYGKEWTTYTSPYSGKRVCMPQKIAVTRKYDSVDTPANRLIKFAFEKFDFICESLIKNKNTVNAEECVKEAENMHRMLDTILHDRFFDDIGDMDVVPQNNQVLQKREGYSQIFAAFYMIDLALQLNWRGQDEVYEGESKNVALLYEYWLFFELYDIVRSIQGCVPVKTDDAPFISEDNGLTLSLKESSKSCQAFELQDEGIKINLYYNRTFSGKEFESTGYEGSYSRPFRPDYTLAVFPNSYKNEKGAIKGGAVSYIHFDAKYRVDKIDDLVGSIDDATLENELDTEKQDAILNTYKRGDLLKMHTYNDAIRRTVGSYVLYPGATDKSDKTFRLYDELLPGVGAFAIRPSIRKSSEKTIRQFILDLINVRKQSFSRLGRLDQYKEMVVREPGMRIVKTETAGNEDKCIIGYLRSVHPGDYYNFLLDNHKLCTGGRFLFYFYAIKDGNVYSHHKDAFTARYIRFYCNDIQISKSYRLEPFVCRVETNELVSRDGLVKQLNELGYETTAEQHHADFYYVLNVEVYNDDIPSLDLPINQVNGANGNDTYSPHSPKVIML